MSDASHNYPENCVLWPGRIDRDGYGCMVVAGRNKRAHRIFFERFVGPIPDGMGVLHSCDVRACINPAHLHVGTQLENITEAVERNRMRRGTRSPTAKLNAEQVRAIRSGMPRDEAIAKFGIKKTAYYRVRRGDGYNDVGPSQ